MKSLELELLKQHIAITQSNLDVLVRVASSLELDAAALEAELRVPEAGAADDVQEALAKAEERVRNVEAMLAKAVADLHFVMAGGDPCKVCTVKCLMGEGNCKPVWRGEEDVQ